MMRYVNVKPLIFAGFTARLKPCPFKTESRAFSTGR
jgi:hypothetical protein